MLKILILGGNRFFGKRLAQTLLSKGHSLTLLNRGNLNDGLENSVERIVCDRKNLQSLEDKVKNRYWDIIYDQICFDFETAKEASKIFKDKTDKYIFTSSQSVYPSGPNLKESDFDHATHSFEKFETKDSNYPEAKRQAEVAFSKFAPFSIVYVRLPIVIGNDDYTKRFSFHIERILKSKPIYFPNPDARISFIDSQQAAIGLSQLCDITSNGPLNMASPKPIRLLDFILLIEKYIGKKAILSDKISETDYSPYGIKQDWFMDCSKMQSLNIRVSEITDWIHPLLQSQD